MKNTVKELKSNGYHFMWAASALMFCVSLLKSSTTEYWHEWSVLRFSEVHWIMKWPLQFSASRTAGAISKVALDYTPRNIQEARFPSQSVAVNNTNKWFWGRIPPLIECRAILRRILITCLHHCWGWTSYHHSCLSFFFLVAVWLAHRKAEQRCRLRTPTRSNDTTKHTHT